MKKSFIAVMLSVSMLAGQVAPVMAAEAETVVAEADVASAEADIEFADAEREVDDFGNTGEETADTPDAMKDVAVEAVLDENAEDVSSVEDELPTEDVAVADDTAEAPTDGIASHAADPGTEGENYSFDLDTGLLEIFDKSAMDGKQYQAYKLYATKLVVNGDNIDKIPAEAFKGFSGLKSFDLDSAPNLTTIGWSAFQDCIALTEVRLPDSVTTLECGKGYRYADNPNDSNSDWVGNGWKSNNSNTVDVAPATFKGCTNLKSFDTGDGLTELTGVYDEWKNSDDYSRIHPGWQTYSPFWGCDKLESVRIGKAVKTIGIAAFAGRKALSSVSMNNADALTTIANFAFGDCSNLGDITIPDNVKNINDIAFGRSGVVNLKLGNSVEKIGRGSFYDNEMLKSVDFNAGLESIMWGAFAESSVSQISLPKYVVNFEGREFYNCKNLKSVVFPEKLSALTTNEMFSGCDHLEDVTLPEGLTSITGTNTFENCTMLKKIVFPDGLLSTGNYTFKNCSALKDISFPDGLQTIGEASIEGTAIEELKMNRDLTSIGNYGFKGCSNLTKVTFNDKITSIGFESFMNDSALAEIVFPKTASLTTIGYSAFQNCTSLTEVKLPDSVTTLECGKGYRYADNPNDSNSDWVGNGWKTNNSNTVDVAPATFKGCTNLKSFDTGDGLTELTGVYDEWKNSDDYSRIHPGWQTYGPFWGCDKLESVRIGKSVKTVGIGVFAGRKTLTSVDLSEANALSTIGKFAFGDCTALSCVNLPSTGLFTTIADVAFIRDSGLKMIKGGNNVNSIGTNAFYVTNDPDLVTLLDTESETMKGVDWTGWNRELTDDPEALYTRYNVSFETNGGSSVEGFKVSENGLVKKPDDPVREGYDFGAWYKDNKLTDVWDFNNDRINANTTLYARWKPQIKISNETEHGTVSADAASKYAGETVTLSSIPEKGYQLDHYEVNGGRVSGSFTMPATTAVVKAYFTKIRYEITTTSDFGEIMVQLLDESGEAIDTWVDYGEAGDSMQVICEPYDGYKLDELVVDGVSVNYIKDVGYKFTMPYDKVSIVATFVLYNSNVIVLPAENGQISANVTSAKLGDQIELTSTPDTGYRLSYYTRDNVRIWGDSFTMGASDTKVSAVFEKEPYDINVASVDNGYITLKKYTALFGDTVEVTATPDTGYELDYITVNGKRIEGNSFVMPAGDVTIGAVFAEAGKKSFTVSVDAVTGGYVTSNVSFAVAGDTVTLSAVPDEDYELDYFTVDGEIIVGNSFMMPENDVAVSAVFKKIEKIFYSITVVKAEGGVVTASVSQANAGVSVKLTEKADTGYEFDYFTVDGVKISGDSFNMPAKNVTVSAVFSALPETSYSITIEAAENGSISVNRIEAKKGDKVSLSAEPVEGYELDYFTVNGEKIEGDSFEMPAKNVKVSAVFKKTEKEKAPTTTVKESAQQASGEGKGAVGDTVGTKSEPKLSTLTVVSTSENRITIIKGGKVQITNGKLGSFYSTEKKNVSVNKKGLIKAKKGTTTAEVSFRGMDEKEFKVKITVLDPTENIQTLSGNVVTKKLKHQVSGMDAFDVVLRNIPLNAYEVRVTDKSGSFEGLTMQIGNNNADKDEPDDKYYHLLGKAVHRGKATVSFKVNGKKYSMKVAFK